MVCRSWGRRAFPRQNRAGQWAGGPEEAVSATVLAGTGSPLLGLPQRALSWVGPADSEVRVWTVLMTDLPEGEES